LLLNDNARTTAIAQVPRTLLKVPRERIARDLICSLAGTSAERSTVDHRRADIPFLTNAFINEMTERNEQRKIRGA